MVLAVDLYPKIGVGDCGGGGEVRSPIPDSAKPFFCFGGAAGRQLDVPQTFAVKNYDRKSDVKL
ncbi:MAG: hypothetical protein ACYTX0_38845 [Nostoc sp.]